MSQLGRHPLSVQWLEDSEHLFYALKREFAIADMWSFSIASPDAVPSDADPSDLRDLDGGVAFMLRRIQAIRNLLSIGGAHQAQLTTGYAADLYLFLAALINQRRIGDPLNEGFVVTAAESTKNLLALVANPPSDLA